MFLARVRHHGLLLEIVKNPIVIWTIVHVVWAGQL